jgi:hypothetical protein
LLVNQGVLVGHQGLTSVILAIWEAEIRRITIEGQTKQIAHENHISKITKAKWTGSVAQVVEHLLCKCEALNSNHRPTKNPKKQKQGVFRSRQFLLTS